MGLPVKNHLFTLTSAQRITSQADVFRGARFSSLLTNAYSTENNIPFLLFYLSGK